MDQSNNDGPSLSASTIGSGKLVSLASPFSPPHDAPIKPVLDWAQYMTNSHCGYCNGNSVSAKTTERESSAMYALSLDYQPVIDLSQNDPRRHNSNRTQEEESADGTETVVRSMPVETYSKLLNMGFRRSGKMFYKVDQRNSCCPQYTMRLDVSKYKPSKEHRKALSRFNRWVRGESLSNLEDMSSSLWVTKSCTQNQQPSSDLQAKPKHKTKNEEYNLHYQVHSVDADFDHIYLDKQTEWSQAHQRDLQLLPNDFTFKTVASPPHDSNTGSSTRKKKANKHTPIRPLLSTCRPSFRVCLKVAKPTREKYALFKKYQIAIHKEKEDEVSAASFARFLCRSPLNELSDDELSPEELELKEPVDTDWIYKERIADSPLPHDLYGRSEYTTVDDLLNDTPELSLEDVARLGGGTFHQEYWYLGKLVAFGVLDILPGNCVSSVYLVWDPAYPELELGKVSALREIALTKELQLPYYCLGLYVPSCPKMLYKSTFKPAELLDPMAMPEDFGLDGARRWFPIEEYEKRWDKDGTHTDWYVSVLERESVGDDSLTLNIEGKKDEVVERKEKETAMNPPYTLGLNKVIRELCFSGSEIPPILRYLEADKIYKMRMPGVTSFSSLNALLSDDQNPVHKEYHKLWTTRGPQVGLLREPLPSENQNIRSGRDPRNVYTVLTFQQFWKMYEFFPFFSVRMELAAVVGIDFSHEFVLLVN